MASSAGWRVWGSLLPLLLAAAVPAAAGPVPAVVQKAAAPSDAALLHRLDRQARTKGIKNYAIGSDTCRRLGLKPIGDCVAFRLEAPKDATSDGFVRSVNIFDEPGTGTVRIIVFKQNAGEIFYYLCGLDGALVRAAYEKPGTPRAWYKVPNEQAMAGFEQELDFWRREQGEPGHAAGG